MNRDKRLRRIGLGFIAIIGVLALGFVLVLSGAFSQPPPIGRDLPRKIAEAREIFDARVQAEWPLPIAEAALIADLEARGFKVDALLPDQLRVAQFREARFPCTLRWSVRWTATDGAVDRIFGVYGATCP